MSRDIYEVDIDKFVKVYSPLYCKSCEEKYKTFAKEKLGITINHPVLDEDEETIVCDLKKGNQSLNTIKWKLGVPLDKDSDPIKTHYHSFSKKSLEDFCRSTNEKQYQFSSNEEIRNTFEKLSKKVEELDLKGYGSVYLISSMFFLSQGIVPIYDYYAHVAAKALLYKWNPQDIYVAGAPGRREHSRGDKYKNSAVNLLLEYKLLLEMLFKETSYYNQDGMLISRKLDQALWVYGHATVKCTNSLLNEAINSLGNE